MKLFILALTSLLFLTSCDSTLNPVCTRDNISAVSLEGSFATTGDTEEIYFGQTRNGESFFLSNDGEKQNYKICRVGDDNIFEIKDKATEHYQQFKITIDKKSSFTLTAIVFNNKLLDQNNIPYRYGQDEFNTTVITVDNSNVDPKSIIESMNEDSKESYYLVK